MPTNSALVKPSFSQDFSGQIVLPTDAQYEEVRHTFASKGSPAVVFLVANTQDVALAIQYARENHLALAVRSGGHSVPGFSTSDGGVVIDLRQLNTIELIDPASHRVKIGSGATWSEVSHALQPHGLVLSSGDTKTVGVGGLTLGGGIGWLVRTVGLALDNLLAAEIVTADGQVLQLSDTENSDLFWAIRGGGGNFGVVTSFEFKAYPLQSVFAGSIVYGHDDLPRLLTGWRDAMRTAPEALNSTLLVMPQFGENPPSVILLLCYAGEDEDMAMHAIAPLKQLGKPLKEEIKNKEYAEVLEEAHPPPGMLIIAQNTFLPEFSDELIAHLVEQYSSAHPPILQIRSLGGALNKVAADATAFAERSAEVFLMHVNFLPPDAPESEIQAAHERWSRVAAFGSGTYGGLLTQNAKGVVEKMYPPPTLDRLKKVKQQYDPENVFSLNFNIEPN